MHREERLDEWERGLTKKAGTTDEKVYSNGNLVLEGLNRKLGKQKRVIQN